MNKTEISAPGGLTVTKAKNHRSLSLLHSHPSSPMGGDCLGHRTAKSQASICLTKDRLSLRGMWTQPGQPHALNEQCRELGPGLCLHHLHRTPPQSTLWGAVSSQFRD